MYGTQNKKGDDLQNAFPGCMGMMINVFDMSAGLPKLITEQQLRDDQPGMLKKKTTDKFGVSKDDQASYFRKYSSYKSSGTPMKMLIEHEMSREPQPNQNSSNVVAKLMGLDAMPKQLSTTKSKNSSHEKLQSFTKCKIVNEVWHKPPQNRLQHDSSVEKRMALVRQKFNEAKNLATNVNLLQSSKFEDAIDVLSSNRDLFLKFFEEPNAIFSKQSYETQNKHLSSHTRRITVLKPSQTMEVKENSQRREFFVPNDINQNTETVNNPVRIVVLKPSLGMSHQLGAPIVSSELEHSEAKESREIARKITRKMQEYVSNREECSSKEDCDYTSDLESLTPTSRFGSPISISSYSCASLHSSGSSVIKEAKKRLSERLFASNEINQEHSQMMRSSSTTLGEMLSFSEGKKEEVNEDSPRKLVRSKSVPISSSSSELTGSREEVGKEVVAKSKSGISSFRETVSTLFSSRRKNKMGNCSKKANPSLEATQSIQHSNSIEHVPVHHEQKHRKASSASISKTSTSIEKCHFTDSHDQPSPSSVLEAPFEDYLNNKISLPSTSIILCHPQALSRSPPIGSISRTLSCDNIHRKPVTRVLPKECLEQERLTLVQNLLSHANLSHDKDSTTIIDNWHSLNSPLDPILLHEFLDRKEEEEEAKCRERRSNQRLIFDCVNAALLSIAHTTLVQNYPFVPQANCNSSFALNEEVWRILNDWKSCENVEQHMLVEKFIKEEITGIGWVESMSVEVDEFSREIVEMVLEELVEDTLPDLVDASL